MLEQVGQRWAMPKTRLKVNKMSKLSRRCFSRLCAADAAIFFKGQSAKWQSGLNFVQIKTERYTRETRESTSE